MDKFKPGDKVVPKAKANNNKWHPPVVMTIIGRVVRKNPPENDLHRIANLRQIDDKQEIYLCEWIHNKKRTSKTYAAKELKRDTTPPSRPQDPGWRRI
jgi:hypothetical protein